MPPMMAARPRPCGTLVGMACVRPGGTALASASAKVAPSTPPATATIIATMRARRATKRPCLAPERLAILPATSHTAVIDQVDLLMGFIEPFLQGETPKGMFE